MIGAARGSRIRDGSRGPVGRQLGRLGRPFGGVAAVGVKELRGRMRGRRAFVNLTLYLSLLTGFAWMVEQIGERSVSAGFGGPTIASAVIGQNIFIALLLLETLLVLVLTPGFTAGAISLEREKQTLDLLAVTPISSLAIVLGKLLSALTYVFLLILASVPLTAMVFVFGGVAPDDLIRGYVVLVVTALGMGSVGLFTSSLFKRTQGATVVTYAIVVAMTLGGAFLWVFWTVMSPANPTPLDSGGVAFRQDRPPEAILWLNPFVADADVVCGTENGFSGTWCSIVAGVTGQQPFVGVQRDGAQVVPIGPNGVPIQKALAAGQVFPFGAGPDAFGANRDTYWPRAAAAWIVLSVVLIGLSAQLVSPTRRWRLRRGRAVRAFEAPTVETAASAEQPSSLPAEQPSSLPAEQPSSLPAELPSPLPPEAPHPDEGR